MGGCGLRHGVADLGQFTGSRHGVWLTELGDHGGRPRVLHSLSLPYEWVTNFVVRKCAHFTEYMVLGVLVTHAFDIEGRRTFDRLLPTVVFLLLIPSIDETIQLFVPGRAGMITDVMIDCCGAATGVVLRYLLRSLVCTRKAA